MIRKATFSIEHMEEVLKPIVLANLRTPKKIVGGKAIEITLDGETIYALSNRYKLFFTKGYTCVKCGATASFFALERSKGKIQRYHLNLYGYNSKGKELLFTKDHILPKSRGGKDHLSNYQTMCEHCNSRKGNKTDAEFALVKQPTILKEMNFDPVLFVHPVQDLNQYMVIQHNGQFINIRMGERRAFYVDTVIGARKYKAKRVESLLQEAISEGILTDTNMSNYKALSNRRLKREYQLSLV